MQTDLTIFHKNRRRAGVTLLELLVVIVIMAVIMSISIPAFTSIGRGAGMRGAVASVTSTLSLSRQWAITKRERVVFQYGNTLVNNNNVGYFVVYAVTNASAEAAGQYQDSRLTIQSNRLDNALSFDSTDPTEIKFKTDGGLTFGTTTHSFKITDPSDMEKTIRVNGLTGNVSVQ